MKHSNVIKLTTWDGCEMFLGLSLAVALTYATYWVLL